MEMIILDSNQTKTGFRSIQKENIIESFNSDGLLFHKVDLSYIKEGLFVHYFIGYRTDEELKELLQKLVLPLALKNIFTKSIVETSQMEGSFDGINQWLSNDFIPKIVESGLKYEAVIIPKDLYAQLAVEFYIEENNKNGFTNKIFNSFEQAYAWINSFDIQK